MSTIDEEASNDLFEVDKRLTLKPVLEFSKLLREAFSEGSCSCIRCESSGNDQEGYDYQHTFDIGGPVNRRFAKSTASDVLQSISKAWLAYFKVDMSPRGTVDLESMKVFAAYDTHARLSPLMLACGLAKYVDGALIFQAVND